ncbi:unnamed protein product [Angiostrongylus costaricensis]|uniref:Pentatricopeptide repeat-containing protein n=1 Tax=Angiostrongylus costaricensis TaxID=334426 RepID=A0A0R3PQC6_ANGCS|nr:unnamed protein product [Angiostrongylus costaricensis]
MKANDVPVSETVLESLIYSVAKNGHYSSAESLAKVFRCSTFSFKSSVQKLLLPRSDFSVVVNTIASIPSTAKLNQVSNNTYILDVLFEMLDAGQMDAIEKLSPYLTMSSEGPYLAEWHVNPKVLARARLACTEGKLHSAVKLYTLLHPKFKNRFFLPTIFLFSLVDFTTHAFLRICDIIASLRSNGTLEKCLSEKPSLRKSLARGLSDKVRL